MTITIGKRIVGSGKPILIVAELSANHLHKYELAEKTLHAAKEAGADAIKLQTYTADTITIDCKNKYFLIKGGTIWDGKTFYELYKEAYTPWEWHAPLQKLAKELGLIFFSTPFDKTAVDYLEKLKVPMYKIGSPEIVDIPLIEYAAKKGKPMLLSTGIATEKEIREAVDACRKVSNKDVVVLKCTSAYPTPLEEVNLRTMPDMAERFGVLVGISDHSQGISVPIAAAALGASIIEKHFILDRKFGGPDSEFSLEPAEFKEMVKRVRETEKLLGKATYELTEKVKVGRRGARSLFVVEDMKKGELFTEKNIRSIRPCFGLAPKEIKTVLGKKAKKDIERGTPLSWSLIAKAK